jgi:hypothetical protein
MRTISTGLLVGIVLTAIVAVPAAAMAGDKARIPPGWNPFGQPIFFSPAPPVFKFEIESTEGQLLYFAVEHEYLELGNAKVFQSVEPEGWTIVVIPSKGLTGANADLLLSW